MASTDLTTWFRVMAIGTNLATTVATNTCCFAGTIALLASRTVPHVGAWLF